MDTEADGQEGQGGLEGTPEGAPEGEGQQGEVEPTAGQFSFSADQLPDEWAGKSAQEISMIWKMAAQQLADKNDQIDTLRTVSQQPQVVEPTAAPEPEVDLKELLYDDPVKAFDLEINKRLRPYIKEYEKTAAQTAYMSAGKEFSDFDSYEETVRGILTSGAAPVTPETVRAAYFMARGIQSMETEKAESRKNIGSEKPSAPVTETTTPKLEGLEAEIAAGMDMSSEEYAEFMNDEMIDVEVPDGNG